MTEDDFRDQEVLPALRSFGYVRRLENSIGSDMADLVACLRPDKKSPWASSWIELKHADSWPARATTPLRFNHFSSGQANWLRDWCNPGCKTCVLARVENDYFLISGVKAKELHQGMRRDRILFYADVFGTGTMPVGRIVRWLTAR